MHEENWNFISTYKKMPPRMHALDKRLWSLLNYDEQYSSLPTKFLHGIVFPTFYLIVFNFLVFFS